MVKIIKHITKKEYDTWEKLECIGKGTYGKVYRYRKEGKDVAVKIMNLYKEDNINDYVTYKELTLMRNLSHPNVMRCKQWYTSDKNKLYIFMKYMNEFSLKRIMYNGKYIPHNLKLQIMSQMVCGLAYLHSKNIIHRDIRPDNIFISKISNYYKVKIGDYSISNPLQSINYSHEWNAFPFLQYKPPEGLYYGVEHIITPKSDIWSLGVIMYMLLTEYNLFVGHTDKKIIKEIANILGRPTIYNWPNFDINKVNSSYIKDIYKYLPNTKKYNDFWKENLKNIKNYDIWITIFKSIFKYDPSTRISSKELLKIPLSNFPQKKDFLSIKSINCIKQTDYKFMEDVTSVISIKIDTGNIQKDFFKYFFIISDFNYSFKTISTATYLYKLYYKQLGKNKLYAISCMHIASMMREKNIANTKDYLKHSIDFLKVKSLIKKQLKLMNYNIIPVCSQDYLEYLFKNKIFDYYSVKLFNNIKILSRYILVFLGFIHRYSLLDSNELSNFSLSLAHTYYNLVYNGPKYITKVNISKKDLLFIEDNKSYNIALELEEVLKLRYKNRGPHIGINNIINKINI